MPPASTALSFPKAGYVSIDYIVTFEDVKKLPPTLAHATTLLRTGRYQEALFAFHNIQRVSPAEALAYRGENEASRFLNTLDATASRYEQCLSVAETHSRPTSDAYLAALHYALGDVVMMKNYPNPIGTPARDLGPEPRRQLLEAIRLNPRLLEAHLALGAYYEHASQEHGTAARREYDICSQLRPDVYQTRYLHAASWDRPGFLANEAQLRSRGFQIPNDEKMMPDEAIPECLALTHDHPNYAPPYYRLGSDYAFPKRDFARARHYLFIYSKIGDPTSPWWRYAIAEMQTIDRAAAKHK